jgi:predicted outer membrane repeat protein
VVINSTFTSNSADFGGGALYTESASVELTDSEFSLNCAGDDGGGAALIYRPRSLAASGCTFTSNSADVGGVTSDGGAVKLMGGQIPEMAEAVTMMVKECDFSLNSATKGGALSVVNVLNEDGWVSMAQSQFHSNAAVIGGAVSVEGPVGRIGLDECRFLENSGSQVRIRLSERGSVGTSVGSTRVFQRNSGH